MNENTNIKPNYTLYVLIILITVVAIAGITFAFFAPQFNKPNGDATAKIISGKLDVDFTTTEYILNTNTMLIKDSERAEYADKTSFQVKHAQDSEVNALYDIYLSSISITDNFKSVDFKWELLSSNTVVATGNLSTVGVSTEFQLNATPISLPLTDTHSYELRMWLSETNADQLSLLEGNFSAKVKVVVVNAPAS